MYTLEEGEPSVFERETSKAVLAAQVSKQKMLYGAQRAGRDYDHQVCTLACVLSMCAGVSQSVFTRAIAFCQDFCQSCMNGGEIVCCDWCPCAYHLDCARLKKVPTQTWSCPHHRCVKCNRSSAAAGGLLFRLVLPSGGLGLGSAWVHISVLKDLSQGLFDAHAHAHYSCTTALMISFF